MGKKLYVSIDIDGSPFSVKNDGDGNGWLDTRRAWSSILVYVAENLPTRHWPSWLALTEISGC